MPNMVIKSFKRLFFLALLASCLIQPAFGGGNQDTEEEDPLDYGVCRVCQSHEYESGEINDYLEMIAGFRWAEYGTNTGRLRVEDAQGQVTMYRWTSDEGTVVDLEILSTTKPSTDAEESTDS